MAENNLKIRTISWPAVAVQVIILAFLIKLLSWMGLSNPFPFLVGPPFYLFIAFGLRGWLEEDHRKGMKAIRSQNYHAALEYFDQSIEFFENYPKVDKYRALTLLSAARFSFREMGMVNKAYCLGQVGRVSEMAALYRQVFQEYPENDIARMALELMDLKEE
ncbi:MAG: hypothetical protein KDC34_16120 [Saprospiraceae bacterium]|nr:hypothetical protein [Saprospiraceae bacterium]